MARPERIRKIQLFWLICPMPFWAFVRKTMPQDITRTTAVLRAVARVEFTPSIPTFARIEVRAAKIDERIANNIHIILL